MYSLILFFMLFLVIGESFAWSTASTLKPESSSILLSSPLITFFARTIGLFIDICPKCEIIFQTFFKRF